MFYPKFLVSLMEVEQVALLGMKRSQAQKLQNLKLLLCSPAMFQTSSGPSTPSEANTVSRRAAVVKTILEHAWTIKFYVLYNRIQCDQAKHEALVCFKQFLLAKARVLNSACK